MIKKIFMILSVMVVFEAPLFARRSGETPGDATRKTSSIGDRSERNGGRAGVTRSSWEHRGWVGGGWDDANLENWKNAAATAIADGVVYSLHSRNVGAPWERNEPGWDIYWHEEKQQGLWYNPNTGRWFDPKVGYFED